MREYKTVCGRYLRMASKGFSFVSLFTAAEVAYHRGMHEMRKSVYLSENSDRCGASLPSDNIYTNTVGRGHHIRSLE